MSTAKDGAKGCSTGSLSREAALVARESIYRNASSTLLEFPSKELLICRLTDFVVCQPLAIVSNSSKARVSNHRVPHHPLLDSCGRRLCEWTLHELALLAPGGHQQWKCVKHFPLLGVLHPVWCDAPPPPWLVESAVKSD